MTYEAWRITFQSSEQAARAAYAEFQSASARLHEVAVACASAEAERDALRAELDSRKGRQPVGWLDESDLRALGHGNSVWLNPDDQGGMLPVFADPVPANAPQIEYSILREFADKKRCNFNELCDAVTRAVSTGTGCPIPASVPNRITPDQAPAEIREYAPIAAEGYADGWNACVKAMRGEAPKDKP